MIIPQKIYKVSQIERPWSIRIPYFDVTIYEAGEDPKNHFTVQEVKSLSQEDFLSLVRARLAASNTFKDHALIFVHGYDTSFLDSALFRTAQIAYGLKFDGAPFLYSWPSGGAVTSYTYDRESAEGSEPYLRQFLDLVVKETGAKTISVIAHSMGNRPLLDVLKDMKSAAPQGVVISQIILAAPDVEANTFTNLARAIYGLAKGVTLYAASNDRALLISRNIWRSYGAGVVPASGPLVLPGIDTIDVTAASTDVLAFNHSEYAENNALLGDIGKLIESGLRPSSSLSSRRKGTIGVSRPVISFAGVPASALHRRGSHDNGSTTSTTHGFASIIALMDGRKFSPRQMPKRRDCGRFRSEPERISGFQYDIQPTWRRPIWPSYSPEGDMPQNKTLALRNQIVFFGSPKTARTRISPMKAPLTIAAMAGAIAFTSSAFAQVPDPGLPTEKIAPSTQPDMQGLPDNEKLGGPAQKIAGQLDRKIKTKAPLPRSRATPLVRQKSPQQRLALRAPVVIGRRPRRPRISDTRSSD